VGKTTPECDQMSLVKHHSPIMNRSNHSYSNHTSID